MSETKQWVIAENPGLLQRSQPLFPTGPLEAQNVQHLTEGALEMRQGFGVESLAGSGLTGPVLWAGRHVTNAGVEELWAAANNAGTPALARRVSGAWSSVAFSDTPSAPNLLFMQGVTMNGKFFLAYDSNMNRLHVWDGTILRRVGLAPPGAATSAPVGGGGAAVTRSYRQRYAVFAAGVVRRRSEPGPVTTVTTTMNVTVFQSTPSVEETVLAAGETAFWELEAANTPAGPWYIVQWFQTLATASVVDGIAAPLTLANTIGASVELGLYVPPPSAKHLSTDGLTLTMGGAWETATTGTGETIPKANRVWFTRPLGASDIGDDESIPDSALQKNWLDVGDAGPITALASPFYGETTAFKEHGVAKLTPTGNIEAPYALSLLNDAIGCVDARLLDSGELDGMPVVYFADSNAIYVYASGGVKNIAEQIGRDLRAKTLVADPGLLLFDSFQRVMLVVGSNSAPLHAGSYEAFSFDSVKQRFDGFSLGGAAVGWVLGTGLLGISTPLGGSGASIFNGTFATGLDGTRRLFLCGNDKNGAAALFSWGTQAALDGIEPMVSLVRYRKVLEPGRRSTVMAPTVFYRNPQGTTPGTLTLSLFLTRDFNDMRSQSKTLDVTEDDNGISVKQVTFEGLAMADVSTLDVSAQLTYSGTAYQSEVTPALDAIVVPYIPGEPLAR